MKNIGFIAIIFFIPLIVNAETYLCISEAGAVVEDGANKKIDSGLSNVSNSKYILTNESGKWLLKKHGGGLIFSECKSSSFCESSKGFSGIFFKSEKNIFSRVWLTVLNGRNQLITEKGYCSKI